MPCFHIEGVICDNCRVPVERYTIADSSLTWAIVGTDEDSYKNHKALEVRVKLLEEMLSVVEDTLNYYSLIHPSLEHAQVISGNPAREALTKLEKIRRGPADSE